MQAALLEKSDPSLSLISPNLGIYSLWIYSQLVNLT